MGHLISESSPNLAHVNTHTQDFTHSGLPLPLFMNLGEVFGERFGRLVKEFTFLDQSRKKAGLFSTAPRAYGEQGRNRRATVYGDGLQGLKGH